MISSFKWTGIVLNLFLGTPDAYALSFLSLPLTNVLAYGDIEFCQCQVMKKLSLWCWADETDGSLKNHKLSSKSSSRFGNRPAVSLLCCGAAASGAAWCDEDWAHLHAKVTFVFAPQRGSFGGFSCWWLNQTLASVHPALPPDADFFCLLSFAVLHEHLLGFSFHGNSSFSAAKLLKTQAVLDWSYIAKYFI